MRLSLVHLLGYSLALCLACSWCLVNCHQMTDILTPTLLQPYLHASPLPYLFKLDSLDPSTPCLGISVVACDCIFLKTFFWFVCVSLCVPRVCSWSERPKGALDLLELGFQVVMSCLMLGLWTETRFPAVAVKALNPEHLSNPLPPLYLIFSVCTTLGRLLTSLCLSFQYSMNSCYVHSSFPQVLMFKWHCNCVIKNHTIVALRVRPGCFCWTCHLSVVLVFKILSSRDTTYLASNNNKHKTPNKKKNTHIAWHLELKWFKVSDCS